MKKAIQTTTVAALPLALSRGVATAATLGGTGGKDDLRGTKPRHKVRDL